MQDQIDIKVLWNKVVDEIKQNIIRTTLWLAMEKAVPLVMEDNIFVVGFPSSDYHLSGNMLSSDHKNAIDMSLRKFSGLPLMLRIVDGDTLQDWENVKLKDYHARAIQESDAKKREAENAITRSWDGLMESVSRKYAAKHLRQLPQFRAAFILEILEEVSETIDVLMPDEEHKSELAERSLARIIDKIGQLTETPPAWIAIELKRMRNEL
jgi:hypothetical protein